MERSSTVERLLPIDATLIGPVLTRLRRDATGRHQRWTLGGHGTVELDVDFRPLPSTPERGGPSWEGSVRLWDADHLAVAQCTIVVSAQTAATCALELLADDQLTPWWQERRPTLVHLAQAAVDEIAEELLWHATREDVVPA